MPVYSIIVPTVIDHLLKKKLLWNTKADLRRGQQVQYARGHTVVPCSLPTTMWNSQTTNKHKSQLYTTNYTYLVLQCPTQRLLQFIPSMSTWCTFGKVSEPTDETESYDSKQNQALIWKVNITSLVKYKLIVKKLNNFDPQTYTSIISFNDWPNSRPVY
jgi:hypothetical protein